MVLKKAVALAANPLFSDGYWLILRQTVLKTPCPDGGFFVTEYDIRRKLTAASTQKLGRMYGKPLKLKPEVNEETDRWDLRLDLRTAVGGAFHTHYHRVVGLTLKKTKHGINGFPLRNPEIVSTDHWKYYEVDHVNWNNLDCRLRNLDTREQSRHRGEGRRGSHVKSLPHSTKVKLLKSAKVKLFRRPAAFTLYRRPAAV